MDDYHQLIANRVTEQAEKLGRLIDYVEVGVCIGDSAEAVLSTGKVRYAVLIDNFSNTYCGVWQSSKALVESRLERFGDVFHVIKANSSDTLPTIKHATFDVGFVDGDHSEKGCLSDMEQMWPLIRETGVMFVDDLNNYSLLPVVKGFAEQRGLKFTHHNVHFGLGELTR